MVAQRTPEPETAGHPHEQEETPAFTRYEHPYDRTAAGPEDAPQGVTYVPLVLHPSFTPNRRITRAQRREALIKQTAIRIVAGLEPRSLRELAEEIECTHTAIHNTVQRFCVRLGLRPVRISEKTRGRLRDARRRQIETKIG